MLVQDRQEQSFNLIQRWFFERTGIYLNETKRPLVNGRLQKRIRQLDIIDLHAYFNLLIGDEREQQIAVNLLTTNETYFFREPKHFHFLQQEILPALSRKPDLRIWSAASSSGQEAYTLAMLLAEQLGLERGWMVHGTDINTQVLDIAERGIYPIEASEKIPSALLKKYCLKGKGKDEGFFMLAQQVRRHVEFSHSNLLAPQPPAPLYDVIFLRNVLIYFNMDEKQRILANVLEYLRPGGWLFVGHSESVTGLDPRLTQSRPGCYRFNQ